MHLPLCKDVRDLDEALSKPSVSFAPPVDDERHRYADRTRRCWLMFTARAIPGQIIQACPPETTVSFDVILSPSRSHDLGWFILRTRDA